MCKVPAPSSDGMRDSVPSLPALAASFITERARQLLAGTRDTWLHAPAGRDRRALLSQLFRLDQQACSLTPHRCSAERKARALSLPPSLSQSLSVSLSPSVCLLPLFPVSLSASLSPSVLCFCLSLCASLCLSFHLSLHLSIQRGT